MASDAPQPLKHPISTKLHDSRSVGERLADKAAEQIGSWRFLIIQSFLVGLWVISNVVGVVNRWDPFPFVLLNLLFSVQAAYTGPVLLLSSNRAAQRDRIMAEHGYATNDKAERLIEGMMSELLRNSVATLAIASHLDIQLDELEHHQSDLHTKLSSVQKELGEVEDALADAKTDQGKGAGSS